MPGFVIIHGNRMEDLRDLLVEQIRAHPPGVLETEWFLVPGPGIAQWLRLALAERVGIAAGTRFLLPDAFLRELGRALDLESPERPAAELTGATLAWRLMKLLPDLPPETAQPVLDYLEEDADGTRRWQLAQRLQACFERYQQYRPDWLDLWQADREVFELAADRAGPRVAATARWQQALWHALIRDAGDLGPDLRIDNLIDTLRRRSEADGIAELPRRLSVIGFSTLPPKQLEALARLGEFLDMMAFVLNPSRYYWGDIVETAPEERAALRLGRQPRRPDAPSLAESGADPGEIEDWHEYGHPLLASWGKQGRDFIALLHGVDQPDDYRAAWNEIDLFRDFASQDVGVEPTLLQALQQRILDLEETPPESAETASLRFVQAYGPMREVEVLRDHVLAALEEIDGLQPSDIIVLCPDVETYAPLVEAAFHSVRPEDEDGATWLPVSVADVTPRGREPYLRAVEQLLGLPESRLTASDVLDLLEVPAFRRRFGIGEEALPRVKDWLAASGVRWGIDAGHRGELGLRETSLNTWRHGLDRMLLGYAVGDSEPWGEVAPLADVGGVEAALAGRLDAVIEALDTWRDRLAGERTPAAWVALVRELMDALLADTAGDASRSRGVIDDALADWQARADSARFDAPVSLAVAREVIFGALDASHASQRFMAGAVNVCGFLPMRAVPFRMVCMLGMNDGAFPRQQAGADFDLLEQHWRPGDRSRRVDDRYLFLEALLAARDRLLITWTGRDAASGGELPPSVLVAQLRDHLARSASARLDALTEEHPLHPFSARYFDPDEDRLPPTFAGEWEHARSGAVRPVEAELPPESLDALMAERSLSLAELSRFLKRPVSVYFENRLRVHLDSDEAEIADDESWSLDGLEAWGLRERLFRTAEAGGDAEAMERLLRLEGLLPSGPLAAAALETARPRALALHEHWTEALADCGAATFREEIDLELEIPLHRGRGTVRLQDWLGDLHGERDAPRLLNLRVGELDLDATGLPKQRKQLLDTWLKHLAACAAGLPVCSLLVGEDGMVTLPAMDRDAARARLAALAGLWYRGRSQPLPVHQDLGCAWLQGLEGSGGSRRREGSTEAARQAALEAYEGAGGNADWGRAGVVETERGLARLYTRFDDLEAAGFVAVTRELYGPFFDDLNAWFGGGDGGDRGRGGKGDDEEQGGSVS